MPTRPRNLRAILWAAATGSAVTVPCHWCGRPLHYADAVADHEPPLSSPGGTPHGAVLSCAPCDRERSRQTTREANAKRSKGKARKPRRRRS